MFLKPAVRTSNIDRLPFFCAPWFSVTAEQTNKENVNGQRTISLGSKVLNVFVCWLVTGAFAHAADFTVNSPSDVVDANPGNGVCETAP